MRWSGNPVFIFAKKDYCIPYVVSKYKKDTAEIADDYVLVTLPYDMEVLNELNKSEHLDEHLNEHLNIVDKKDREQAVIEMIKSNPYVTYDEISAKLNISIATTRRIFSILKKKGIIKGSRINKNDKWEL